MLQELVAAGIRPWCWTSGSGRAEVDFLVALGGEVVPVEVKAAVNLQAKSLRVYRDAYRPPLAVRTSLAPRIDQDGLVGLPLYAVGSLPEVVRSAAG